MSRGVEVFRLVLRRSQCRKYNTFLHKCREQTKNTNMMIKMMCVCMCACVRVLICGMLEVVLRSFRPDLLLSPPPVICVVLARVEVSSCD